RTRLPKVSGLIISGDVTFAGKPAEYVFAANWIESIREQLSCSVAGVMVIPGNHDVDRSLIVDGGAVDQIHGYVRAGATLEQCDALLAEVLRDEARGDTLLAPLKAF